MSFVNLSNLSSFLSEGWLHRNDLLLTALFSAWVVSSVAADEEKPSVQSSPMLVCYIQLNSSAPVDRSREDEPSRFDFDDAVHPFPKLCSHVILAYATIDRNSFRANYVPPKQGRTSSNGKALHEKIRTLKRANPQLKILLSLTEASTNGSNFYQTLNELASSEDKRTNFVGSVSDLVSKYELDGIDISFPGVERCGGTLKEPKENFTHLLEEIKRTMKRDDILTATVPLSMIASNWSSPTLLQPVDFVNVKAFDFHTPDEGVTGFSAPQPSVERTILDLVDRGIPRQKLILGMSLFGSSYNLSVPDSKAGPGVPSSSGALTGRCRNELGKLSYSQVCNFINSGRWKQRWDADQESFFLISKDGRHWISYENEETLHYKVRLLQDLNLGGAMIWSLDADDVNGSCDGGRFPLLSAVQFALEWVPKSEHK